MANAQHYTTYGLVTKKKKNFYVHFMTTMGDRVSRAYVRCTYIRIRYPCMRM